MHSANKGEWSELYAFIKLLRDGKVYAADENVEKIDNIYFPIIKLIREEQTGVTTDYHPGTKIRIFKNGELIDEINGADLDEPVETLYQKIFEGGNAGAFEIKEAELLMDSLHLTKVKAASADKKDMTLQIHDINTGFEPIVGFSVKSDIGNPPTLLNAGKNTRFVYEIIGITDTDMEAINAIDKTVAKEYMVERMNSLFKQNVSVKYCGMKSEVFEDNLIMIDSRLPELYGSMILNHFKHIADKVYDCGLLCEMLEKDNSLNFRKKGIYKYKFKKLLCAAALGMTPGTEWDGLDNASGGYIIIKKDGDIVCYHLYNRNFFEEYLYRNTQFDRPSATRHDYGYIYKENGKYFIDLNVQIRFKSITAAAKDLRSEEARMSRIALYAKKISEMDKKEE